MSRSGRPPSDVLAPKRAKARTTKRTAKPKPEYQAEASRVIGKLMKIIKTYQVTIEATSPNWVSTKTCRATHTRNPGASDQGVELVAATPANRNTASAAAARRSLRSSIRNKKSRNRP